MRYMPIWYRYFDKALLFYRYNFFSKEFCNDVFVKFRNSLGKGTTPVMNGMEEEQRFSVPENSPAWQIL